MTESEGEDHDEETGGNQSPSEDVQGELRAHCLAIVINRFPTETEKPEKFACLGKNVKK